MNWRKILIIVGLFLIVAMLGAAFKMGEKKGVSYGVAHADEINADKKKGVELGTFSNLFFKPESVSKTKAIVQIVKNEQKGITANGFGKVNSASMINITSEVQGKINASIKLKKGTHFKAGQVLFSIKNTDVKIALQARKSGYLTLMTQILPDLKLDFGENFDAWLKFYTAIDVSKVMPPMPKTKSFKEKNFVVSRNIYTEYYSILAEQERLKKYIITAPFTGSIIETFTDNGAIINPGSPVISAMREGKLELEIPISSSQIADVAKGASVMMYDDNGTTASGIVSRIGTFINPQTQTVPVFIEVSESSIDLFNGMFLNAEIACEGYENVVELPRKALITKSEIFKVVDGKIIPITLNIKTFTKNTVLVTGLKDGTQIVVEPIINATDSMEVDVKINNKG